MEVLFTRGDYDLVDAVGPRYIKHSAFFINFFSPRTWESWAWLATASGITPTVQLLTGRETFPSADDLHRALCHPPERVLDLEDVDVTYVDDAIHLHVDDIAALCSAQRVRGRHISVDLELLRLALFTYRMDVFERFSPGPNDEVGEYMMEWACRSGASRYVILWLLRHGYGGPACAAARKMLAACTPDGIQRYGALGSCAICEGALARGTFKHPVIPEWA
jgi:hypothetical protein